MGIFGKPKLRPYDGAPAVPLAFADAAPITPMGAMPNIQTPDIPQPKRSFFGQGGIGRLIAGSIGDALTQNAGMGTPFMSAMQQRQQQDYEDQLYQRRSAQEWADFTRKHDYEVAHPKAPAPNDTERDYQFILEKDGPEAAQLWLKNRYDPIVNIPLPDGVYLGPRSQLPSTVGGAPVKTQPKGQLRPYGGAPVKTQPKGQLRPYGGPMPSASGGFR